MMRTNMNRQRPYGSLCSEAHYQVARKVAQEGIVLLKNDRQVLPFRPNARVLVVGENAIKMMTVGGGSSSLKAQHEISPLQGLRERLGDKVDYARGYVGDTTGAYNGVTTGQDLADKRSASELIAEAVEKARNADYVVVFGGLNKSDFQDCEGHDRKTFALPYAQDELVEALVKANKNVVFVNISGNAVAMPWISRVPAVVQGWFLGSEAGLALADVLTGEVNPSGSLPFTWPVRLEDCGAHATGSYPGTWRANERVIDEEYKEDIYVGYRWADHKRIRPLFAFGHGLSYTTFRMDGATADKREIVANDSLSFTVSVTNTGQVAGATTIQLYVADKKCSLPRPEKELKAFKKVFLQPGEQRDVRLTIGRSALSFFDDRTQQWTAEPGDFEALLGFSAGDIKKTVRFRLK